MKPSRPLIAKRESARTKLLDAAMRIVREKGFGATSIDELCAAAGVTKGAFFHHFPSKEALGVAAAEHWSATTSQVFLGAPYHDRDDPLDRIFGYLDLRIWMVGGDTSKFTCLAGTMAQEVFQSHPSIRDAAYASISGHAKMLEADLAAAIKRHQAPDNVTAESLALHIQTVLQGSFVISKAKDDPAFTIESIRHLKRYLVLLFKHPSGGDADPEQVVEQTAATRAHLEKLFWANRKAGEDA